jgi:hypothetical protein
LLLFCFFLLLLFVYANNHHTLTYLFTYLHTNTHTDSRLERCLSFPLASLHSLLLLFSSDALNSSALPSSLSSSKQTNHQTSPLNTTTLETLTQPRHVVHVARAKMRSE